MRIRFDDTVGGELPCDDRRDIGRQVTQRCSDIECRTDTARDIQHRLARSEPQAIERHAIVECDAHRREKADCLLAPLGLERCYTDGACNGIHRRGGVQIP